MAFNGERTDIIYDDQHRIVQLDSYVPEVDPDEVFISIDIHEFTLAHPLRGGIDIAQEIDRCSGGQETDDEDDQPDYMLAHIVESVSRPNSSLEVDDNLELEQVAESDDELTIVQHIGKIGAGSIVVAISTYDMEEAALDTRIAYLQGRMLDEIVEAYIESTN